MYKSYSESKIKWLELKLLLFSLIIFFLTILTTFAEEKIKDTTLPITTNQVKELLDDFFQPTLLKASCIPIVPLTGEAKDGFLEKHLSLQPLLFFDMETKEPLEEVFLPLPGQQKKLSAISKNIVSMKETLTRKIKI